jgi:hypothetical protein
VDPLDDAELELHEMERAADRAAGAVAGASPGMVRELAEVRERIRLARWRLGMERAMGRVGQSAAA